MCLIFVCVFLRASGLSDFIICIRASVGVTEPARRGLYVHMGGASETLQEGIGSLCLFCQTLLSPFSESHHHTYYPEDRKKHIYIKISRVQCQTLNRHFETNIIYG